MLRKVKVPMKRKFCILCYLLNVLFATCLKSWGILFLSNPNGAVFSRRNRLLEQNCDQALGLSLRTL